MIFRRSLPLIALLVFAVTALAGATTHKVKKGETFYAIARAHSVSVKRLMAFNNFTDPSKLRAGQSIKIPGKSAKVATKASYRKPRPKSLRVIIDPGHGGRDRGAVWGGVHEADLNLKVALRVEKSLKAQGYTVVMTRRSDETVSLERRARIANQYRNAIFVSIHFNASTHTSVRGAESFYLSGKGKYLAQSIQKRLVGGLGVRDRGCQFRKYSVLSNTACPAVLVECGFISNPSERSRCRSSSYQAAAARGIVSGIERYDRAY